MDMKMSVSGFGVQKSRIKGEIRLFDEQRPGRFISATYAMNEHRADDMFQENRGNKQSDNALKLDISKEKRRYYTAETSQDRKVCSTQLPLQLINPMK